LLVFDLALSKVLSSPLGNIYPGDNVTFTLNVYNQGTADAQNIQITDYIPSGLALNDVDWTDNAGLATLNTPIASLAAGQSTAVDITFTVTAVVAGPIRNWAEISSADDSEGNAVADIDSTPNDDNFSEPGETDDLADDNVTDQDGKNGGDEDDHDPAEIIIDIFDLALDKKLANGQPASVFPGDDVTFTITVYNQGSVDAYNIEVVDYMLEGLVLNDADWTDNAGIISYNTPIALLPAGQSTSIDITFTVPGIATGAIYNYAEIESADNDDDAHNEHPGDVDSNPDDDPFNDGPYVDDEINEKPPIDEDDQDLAFILVTPPGTFDLALRKVISPNQQLPVSEGSDITFTITVFNQGAVDAYNIEVVDYIPTELTLNDNDWVDNNNGTANYVIAGPIPPGGSATVDITFTINDGVSGTIYNFAEIESADNDNNPDNNQPIDFDSNPDRNPDNDGPVVDDEINNAGGDEDDHDVAPVNVGQFDLALIKTLAAGQPAVVAPGSLVTFTITVFNQGDVDAYNVEVVDYIPTELTLNDNDWIDNNNGTANYIIAGPVPAGGSTTVDITFAVGVSVSGEVVNLSEIESAENANGINLPDVDSTPDRNPNNDGPVTDNEINNSNGDEDDHDPASITVTGPPCPEIVAEVAVVDAECGKMNGTAYVTVADDAAAYTYAWSTGATTQAISGLSGGLYQVTVTSIARPECSTVKEVGVGEIGGPIVIATPTDANCISGEGSIALSWTNGVAGYAISWTGPENGNDNTMAMNYVINGLVAGVYRIEVKDANDCSDIAIVEIKPSNGLTVSATPTNASCGESDGSIAISVSGGSANYQYFINNVLLATQASNNYTASNIPGGSYLVKVVDKNGCYGEAEVTLTNPSDMVFGVWTVENANCSGDMGALIYDAANGDASVSVVVSPKGSNGVLASFSANVSQSLTASAGTYVVTYTDANGCVNIEELTIEAPEPLDYYVEYTHPGCYNNDGVISIVEITGTNNPVISVKDANNIEVGTTAVTTGLSAGTYTVSVSYTGVNGETCDKVVNVTLEPTMKGCTFDLALIKQLGVGQPSAVLPGESVTFTITVFNQGDIDAYNIAITDYIPAGLILNDSDWTNNAGLATLNTPIASLLQGQSTTVDITFTYDGSVTSEITNLAEITDAEDIDGNHPDDIDSNPDNEPDNDIIGGDDVTDNSNGDEDDHDPATITGQIFDLALVKKLSAGQSATVAPGDPVIFTITVYNQGTVTAQNIELTDYIPNGLTLNDGDWTNNGDGTASYMLAGPIAAGSSTTVDIAFVAGNIEGQIMNLAEITSATDTDGDVMEDIDSSPDSEPDNDTIGGDDVTDNSNGDEDDHDPAYINVAQEAVYDLALRKTLANGQSAVVKYGDNVTFTIEVFNQGNKDVLDIEVVDYIPAGLTLNDADWTDNGNGTASILLPGVLQPGQSVTVDITLTVNNNAPLGALVNMAEIFGAKDENGNPIDDVDSTPDTNPNNDPTVDDEINNNGGDEDDHDPATITLEVFDLALIKTLAPGQTGPWYAGGNITFRIKVFNQGTIPADNIEITDYIPTQLTLNDNDWTNNGNGTASIVLTDVLAPGAQTFVDITFTINPGVTGEVKNLAEISNATDDNGNPQDDNDSTPNDNPDDDPFGGDDITDNSNGDEDDSDPHTFPVSEFDLALVKKLANGQASTVGPNDLVTFTITVYNQGNVAAKNIDIVDYIPSGLILNDNDWTNNGNGTASYTIAGPINPGGSATVDITFTVSANASGSIVNLTEISDAEDTSGNHPDDVDSTPDTNSGNDTIGGDDITDNSNGDEDDHDPATINVEQPKDFDLALVKKLKLGQSATVQPGDNVTFTITVYNQGELTAYNIDVIDYIPSGLSLNDNDWTNNGDGTASYTIAGPIVPGQSASVDITLTVNSGVSGNFTNLAEITDAEDADGNHPEDIDSNPDDNPDNDTVGGNDITDNSNNDEDDHDPETITVPEPGTFDLALIKKLKAGQSSKVLVGSSVTFTITVFNQGEVAAYNVDVIDYIPNGLTLNDSDWTNNGDGTASYTLAGPIAPGQSASVDITFTVGYNPGQIVNLSEITDAEDEDGNHPEDEDSNPDNNPENDTIGGDDTTDNSNGDEDDHDPSVIDVVEFDLALVKKLAGGQPAEVNVGDNVTFTITVYNQGGVAATDIEITDYMPTGLILNDNDWTNNGNNTATYTIEGPLAPGASTSVDITFTVGANASGTIENGAEISDAKDENGNPVDDVDSTPDTNPGNDTYVDDVINNSGGDEDDHDKEPVTIKPPCDIEIANIEVSDCEYKGDKSKATLTFDLVWSNAKPNDIITVNIDGNGYLVFTNNTTSPHTMSVTIDADGSDNNQITAQFLNNPNCADADYFDAPNPCAPGLCDLLITQVSGTPCYVDPITGKSVADITFMIFYTNPPKDEIIIVTLDGQEQHIDPATQPSPVSMLFTIPADGTEHEIEAYFIWTKTCGDTNECMSPKPCTPECNLEVDNVDVGDCYFKEGTGESIYDVSFTVAWENAPVGELIYVSVGGQTQSIDPAITTSPTTLTFTLPATGVVENINATFATTTLCDDTNEFWAPEPCAPECEISICDVTVGPCEWNGETSEYNLSLKVIWSGAPSGELLKVVVGGQTYTIDPSVTTSPAIINFTLAADGEYETISAMFTGNYNCGDTYCYNSPDDCKPADCNLEVDDVIVGYCNWDAELSESIYNISFVLTWANAPAGDKIEVTVDGNVQTIDPALVTSPQTLTFTGLIADGFKHNINATFKGQTICDDTNEFWAPNACEPPCNIDIYGINIGPCQYDKGDLYSYYEAEFYVSWQNAPVGQLLQVTIGGDHVFIDPAFETSPKLVKMTLPALGGLKTIIASFDAAGKCEEKAQFDAPENCKPGECNLEITDVSMTDCKWNGTTSQFDLSFVVHWTNAPEGEDIIVKIGSQSKTITPASANGSQTVSFTLTADGKKHNIDAYFEYTKICDDSNECWSPEPCKPDCVVNIDNINKGDCYWNGTESLYDVTVKVSWQYPASSTLVVSVGGKTQTLNIADISSPTFVTFTGLQADGLAENVTAQLGTGCSDSEGYKAPDDSCKPGECNLEVTNMAQGPCYWDGSASKFALSFDVSWQNAPAGKIIVTVGGQTQSFTPATKDGTKSVSFTLDANGAMHYVEAYFEGNKLCDDTNECMSPEPCQPEPCDLDLADVKVGNCYYDAQSGTSKHLVSFMVSWVNAPDAETILVTVDGNTQSINPDITTSPVLMSFAANADGLNHNISAHFSLTKDCDDMKTYKAPASCTPDCNLEVENVVEGECYWDAANQQSKYKLTFSVSWTGAPAGELIIVTVDGQTKTIDPKVTSSPTTLSFTLAADGKMHEIDATFNKTKLCDDTNECWAPEGCEPACDLYLSKVNVGNCYWDGTQSKYNVTFNVNWANAPAGQVINILAGGKTQTINPALTTSPASVSFTLTADGLADVLSAAFSGNANCADSETIKAPDNCKPGDCNLEVMNIMAGSCYWDSGTNSSMFTLEFDVYWENAPAGETIIVTVNGMNFTIDPSITTSPKHMSVTLPANGAKHYIEAYFSKTKMCDDTNECMSPKPCTPECNLELTNVNVGDCFYDTELGMGKYNLTYTVSWSNAPAGETIKVTVDGQNKTIDPAITTSPATFTVTLNADGKVHNLVAQFSTTKLCGDTNEYCAPGACATKAALGDFVWLDLDGDGNQDAGEPGIAGVVVTLYDDANNIIGTTTTNASGYYSFTNLNPGTYTVKVPILGPNGEQLTTTSYYTTTLEPGETDNTLDFGYICHSKIGNTVFMDTNGNGVQDVGEPGVPNIKVYLTLPNGSTTMATTNNNGTYSFNNLLPGNYVVAVINGPANSNATTPTSFNVTLSGCNDDNDNDFGFQPKTPTGQIGDFVWNDIDGDGVHDFGEPGIDGVIVTLVHPDGTIETTTTSGGGLYLFTDLPAGNYQVIVGSGPSGYALTTVGSYNVSLSEGEIDLTNDFGFQPPAQLGSIGDFVWFDSDGDGVQDAGEAGIGGVTVTLYDGSNNVIGIQQTDAKGNYLFTNLPAGNYEVVVDITTVPSGFTPTTPTSYTLYLATGEDDLDNDFGFDGESSEYCVQPGTPLVICPPIGPNEHIDFEASGCKCSIKPEGEDCIKFTPLPGFEGIKIINITICKDKDLTDCHVVSVVVYVGCSTPDAVNDNVVIKPGQVIFNGTTMPDANGYDGTDNPVTLNDSDFCDNDLDVKTIVTPPANGTATVVNGEVVYTPNTGFSGTDSYVYQVCNDCGKCDNATVTITVEQPCNTPNWYEVCTEPMQSITVCPEFCLADGYTIVDAQTTYNCSLTWTTECVTYKPLPLFTGKDTIVVKACLGVNCETKYVVVTVGDCDGSGCEPEDITVCTKPGKVENICPEFCLADAEITDFNAPFNCEVTQIGNCLKFKALPGNLGEEVITVKACNNKGECETITITVKITSTGDCNEPINNPPVAVDDSATSSGGETVSINVLTNDSDPDGDPITITNHTEPLHGTLTQVGNTFQYTPDEGYEGIDVFTYTICDNKGLCDQATVTINVVDNACEEITFICAEPVTPIIICPNFCGLGGNDITITDAQTTYNCSIKYLDGACIKYTALPLFAGQETITITGCNEFGECKTIDVVVNVTSDCDDDNQGFNGNNNGNNNGINKEYYSEKLDDNTNYDEARMSIFPVPAITHAMISFTTLAEENVRLEVRNVNGGLVYNSNYQTTAGMNLHRLNTEHYAAGLYIVTIHGQNKELVSKFVKQ
jgi:uncharacterized repeat protein (TIGR01451 family)